MFKEKIQNIQNVYSILNRKLRLVRVQRNILVFLIFLLIAIAFWFMQAMQETTTTQLTYTLNITNVPKEIIFTSEVPKTVNISVSGRGWNILQYWTKKDSRELNVEFSDIEKNNSKLILDGNLWKRLTQKDFGNGIRYVSSLPSTVEVYYSNGLAKRVPVVFNGVLTPHPQYLICGIDVKPDSVDVVAPIYLLDSITSISTVQQEYLNLEDTLSANIALQTSAGIKVLPDSVHLKVCVDLFTDKTIEVPIYCENIPANKVLRTFPSKAQVSFHVSSSMINKISSRDFVVVVDYNDLNSEHKKCSLQLRSQPEYVSHVRVSPEQIEYVIEQVLE
jgi:hypothetical protein